MSRAGRQFVWHGTHHWCVCVCVCACGDHRSALHCFSLCRNVELDRDWRRDVLRVYTSRRGSLYWLVYPNPCPMMFRAGRQFVWYGTHHWCVCACGDHHSALHCFCLCRNLEVNRDCRRNVLRVYTSRIGSLSWLVYPNPCPIMSRVGRHFVWYGTHHWRVCV